MNYRHIFHAGNHADVLKHLLLTLAVRAMQAKKTPFFCADTHAGIGLYDLTSEQAMRTNEAEGGIGRIMAAASLPPALAEYVSAVKMAGYPQHYPGSPWLLGYLAGEQRIAVNELHPEDVETLFSIMHGFDRVQVSQEDAYACLKAWLPPVEKRGLVLIDPPFEAPDEFERLVKGLAAAKSRFATGVYMIWYPIKAHLPVDALHDAIRAQGWHRAWCIEALVAPRGMKGSFNGSGVIILNAPYPVPEQSDTWVPALKSLLGLHDIAAGWLSETK